MDVLGAPIGLAESSTNPVAIDRTAYSAADREPYSPGTGPPAPERDKRLSCTPVTPLEQRLDLTRPAEPTAAAQRQRAARYFSHDFG